MIEEPRYAHTNLIARDGRALAAFYERVLGCVPAPPERHLSGAGLEAGTRIPGARIDGIHLRLPGCGPEGPTLEIFAYSPANEGPPAQVNRPGFGHIAFRVASVPEAREEFVREGGHPVGDVVTFDTGAGQRITWCYLADPEGNIVELQSVATDG